LPRLAVFVDGSFWHGHPSKWHPGRWSGYWDEKIKRKDGCKEDDETSNRDPRRPFALAGALKLVQVTRLASDPTNRPPWIDYDFAVKPAVARRHLALGAPLNGRFGGMEDLRVRDHRWLSFRSRQSHAVRAARTATDSGRRASRSHGVVAAAAEATAATTNSARERARAARRTA
jgi:hypothetical protein